MRYLFLIGVGGQPVAADAPRDPSEMDIDDWVEEMDARGTRIIGDRLRPAADATTVQVRGGELLVTDGPYAEGKDYIAGIDIIEAADLDEAIDVARRHPMAHGGIIEIRPFWVD